MADVYTPAIKTFAEQIKDDDSIAQPWKNYALKHMQECLAVLQMGQRAKVDSQPLKYSKENIEEFKNSNPCTCPEGGRARGCPWHGY